MKKRILYGAVLCALLAALENNTVFGERLDTDDAGALYPLLTVSLLDGIVIPTIIP